MKSPFLTRVRAYDSKNIKILSESLTFSSVYLINDVIAVIGDDEATSDILDKIRKEICLSYSDPKVYLKHYERMSQDAYQFALTFTNEAKARQIATAIKSRIGGYAQNKFLSEQHELSGPIAIRKQIQSQMSQLSNFMQMDEWMKALYLQSYQGLEMCLKQSVISTTGSNTIAGALFSRILGSRDQITDEVSAYSLQTAYPGLEQAFYSPNDRDSNKNPDSSWLPSGLEQIGIKEKQMEDAAVKIQSVMRGYMARRSFFAKKEADCNPDFSTKPAVTK